MRIAVIIKHIRFEELGQDIRKIFLFDIESSALLRIGEEIVSINNCNYIVMVLLNKKVATVYIDKPTVALELLLKKAGIRVNPLSDIGDYPLVELMLKQ